MKEQRFEKIVEYDFDGISFIFSGGMIFLMGLAFALWEHFKINSSLIIMLLGIFILLWEIIGSREVYWRKIK